MNTPRFAALVAVLSLSSFGCAALSKRFAPPPKPVPQAYFSAPDEAGQQATPEPIPLEAPSLPRLPVIAPGKLPEGYFYRNGLLATKNFPSPEAPHLVLGYVFGQGSMDAETFAAQVNDFAASKGATALYRESGSLWLIAPSSATPVYPAASTFWSHADAVFKMDGAAPRETVALSLDRAKAVSAKLGKHECLGFHVALEPKAELTTSPWQTVARPPEVRYATTVTRRWGAWVATRNVDGKDHQLVAQALPEVAVRPRDFGQFVGCTSKAGTWSLRLAQPDGTALGTGEAKVRLYVVKPSEATIAAECARCNAIIRSRGSWSSGDLNGCLPRPMTAELCE